MNQSSTETLSAESPQRIVVALRSSITSSSRALGGKRVIVLHDEETGKFYQLGGEESVVASLFDGTLAMTEVATRLNAAGIQWPLDDINAFAAALVKAGIALVVSLDGQQRPPTNTREATQPRSVLQIASSAMGFLLSQRIPLGNADSIAARLLPWIGTVYSRNGLIVWAISIVFALWIAFDHAVEIASQCKQMFAPESWLWVACIGIAIKVIHELGHATAAKRLGVRVGSVGITLFLLAPLAYVDLTNAWKLNSRWARIQIALGGVYLESWLAILATLLFAWLDDGLPRHLATQVMLIAGPATWFINANPLLRLDGYYALSDATDIPNLRMHGRNRWASLLDSWLLGKPFQEGHLVGWRRQFAMIHAAASVVFQCIWMVGIIVAVSAWTGAAGLLLTCVAVVAWIAMPLMAWWLRHWYAASSSPLATRLTRRRMVTLAASVMLLAASILTARNPFAHGVPVLVQHRDEQVGRASTDGFVTAVLVHGNQFVNRGDLLVEVTDDNLKLKREQMSDELQLNLAKYRQLQNSGKLAEADAANETAKQLRSSIAELDQSLVASQIIAQRDGIVVSEQPEKWLGRYAKRGDVLVRVAEPNDKELLVAIQENDYSAYNNAVLRGNLLAARIRGGDVLKVEPAAAQPRFNRTLPHPALSATVGGDIPVTPDAESPDGFKAAVPIGAAIAAISPTQSLSVRAGQRGILYLDDDQSIYTRLKQIIIGSE